MSYTRSDDGATMIEFAPGCCINSNLMHLAGGQYKRGLTVLPADTPWSKGPDHDDILRRQYKNSLRLSMRE